jgi:DNA mismatch repair protein MutS2
MGLPDEIMEEAKGLLEPQYLRFEDWLNELQKERHQLQTKLQETEQARAQTDALRRDLEVQLEYLVTHREDILASTRRETLSQYEDVRRKLRRADAALAWNAPPAELQEARAEVSRLKSELESQKVHTRVSPPVVGRTPIAVGDMVDIRGLNLQGQVASVQEQMGEAEVNVGKVRLRVELSRVSRVEQEREPDAGQVQIELGPSLSTTELDLRGLRVDEALFRLEEFLDKALRDSLSSIRVVHGRGTGALRQAVREHLSRHPVARSFVPEAPEHGGNGATLVELA